MTLDDGLAASHPAGVKVSLWRWSRRYPAWPLVLLVSTLLVPVLIVQVSPMFVAGLPVTIIPLLWYGKRIREQFLHGDANPGVVVSTNPLRIAVWTDLTQGDGSYPALSVHREPRSGRWAGPLEVGTRVATVGLYDLGQNEGAPHWEQFRPIAIEPIAASPEAAKELLASFSAAQWARLEQAVAQLGPTRDGLFLLPPAEMARTA